jgi:hypothetical protein
MARFLSGSMTVWLGLAANCKSKIMLSLQYILTMTIEEHIRKLIDESKIDLGASEALGAAGYYGHSLFLPILF